MKFAESLLFSCNEVITDLHGKFYFKLDLSKKGLQSSFYYFIPECYEGNTQKYINEFVKPNMTVIDVGAHMGFYTLLFAGLVGEGGRVYSIEPSKENFCHLKENIAINDIRCVKTFQFAVSDEAGTVPLYIHPTEDSGHSLIKSEKPGSSIEEVQAVTLDEFIDREDIQYVDLIKIDAEDVEDKIFKGAQKTLSSGKLPHIVCEMPSTVKGKQERDARELLYACGYKSYFLDRKYLEEFDHKTPVIGRQNILYIKDDSGRNAT
ncbi:MAG: FkbM family methyltransferase [Candidatus Omnitrophota bacterium]